MSTLCTRTTSPLSTNPNYCRIGIEDAAPTPKTSPNTRPVLVRLHKTILQFFVTRYKRRIDRLAFKNILMLDDRTLKDIGVTRQDVKWASRLPLSEDAAIRLEHIARRRK